jgi:hypothetical protein
MPTQTASVTIAATPSNVVLGQTGNYRIVADTLGDPGQKWRHGSASSPWVDGELLVWAAKAQGTLAFEVDVYGTNMSTLVANITTLRTALAQFNYTTTVVVGGQSVAYAGCWPGTLVKKGGTWQDERLGFLSQRLAVSIPVPPE